MRCNDGSDFLFQFASGVYDRSCARANKTLPPAASAVAVVRSDHKPRAARVLWPTVWSVSSHRPFPLASR